MRFWDSAVRGSSALKAALLRNLTSEVATEDGLMVATAMSDFEAFYDVLEWDIAMDVAEAEGFPLRLLALLLQMHSAPRIVMVGDAVSRWVRPSNIARRRLLLRRRRCQAPRLRGFGSHAPRSPARDHRAARR